MSEVRTRFAPSPTGYIHVGGIRTALFAWLTARQAQGQFVLRLEDTDREREVTGAAQHIVDSLHALGLDYDEGPGIGGPYGPYVQSERLDIYRSWAEKLVASGRAYVDPYRTEEVQAFREQAKINKQPFLFRNHRPNQSFVWNGQQPLRFKSDPKDYQWHDIVMGDLKSSPEVIDDFVLMKADGFPTYNFAHIVDDYEMHITHVMRGQEFLASVPKYLNLYEAFGIQPPQFATLPHILATEGNRKLSKRDGAKDILDYVRQGFLPDALISFIATLGWNDGSEQEIFSRTELINKFSLGKVQRSGAHFDERRLIWVNGTYIRQQSLPKLKEAVQNYWPKEATSYPDDYKEKVLGLVQERLKYLAELSDLSIFFFVDIPPDRSLIDNNKQLRELSDEELKQLLNAARDMLIESNFTVDDLNQRLNTLLDQLSQPPAILFSLIRIAATSVSASPGLADTLSVLGRERTLNRLNTWLNIL
jgi:glutamyl-tRNA synthetase